MGIHGWCVGRRTSIRTRLPPADKPEMASSFRLLAVVAGFLLGTLPSIAHAGVVLRLEMDYSRALDPIARRHTDADGEFWSTEPGYAPHDVSIMFYPTNPEVGWVSMDFAAQGDSVIEPILYDNAGAYP